MMLTCMEYLSASKERLEDLDADMDQIRYDITSLQREIARKTEEKRSIEEQLSLTDYEEIKSRLDECISWLRAYPEKLQETVRRKTQTQEEIKQIAEKLEEDRKKIQVYEEKTKYYLKCYEAEYNLGYVELPDELSKDLSHIRAYLETEGKNLHKDTIINNLNSAYFENRGFLVDYQLMQNELFDDLEEEKADEFTPKRLDISARYQGVKISFASLIEHLEEDIRELENLIKDGDRELFEDILANTVSRKIRGKINSSVTWVQKMNSLMNGMNTSSGLKLSLRWRSKTAEQEDQLDTKELVELLKKDYRLMSEEEASRLSAHFRSKVDEARRNARDSAGMVSFYQIMKDALDYRKWFEFQLFCQKSGERQKELTNSVFATFSGGEKAMSMYVPLFSAVVAKYVGGRILEQMIHRSLEQRNLLIEGTEIFPAYKRQKSFLAAGILLDDVSNYAIVCNVEAVKKDGTIHMGMDGFQKEKDMLQVPLGVISDWKQVRCLQQKIYIVENPSVFAMICGKAECSCMCMNGQPRLAGLMLLDLLEKSGTTIYYSGDLDPEGILIAQKLADYYQGKFYFWHMNPEDYKKSRFEEVISDRRMKILDKITDVRLIPVVDEIKKYKTAGYQERIFV